jgi:alpha-L-fucosidase 2
VKGLKARGNVTVDIEWKNGELMRASLRSPVAREIKVRNARGVQTIKLTADVETKIDAVR